MSFTTTTMSAPRIWGFDPEDTEMRVALQAGWRRADLAWERLMERANRAWIAGEPRRAARLFLFADLLARLCFDAADPRRATAPAARALLRAAAGDRARAERLRQRAVGAWAGVDSAIFAMHIAPRARSSLFHLRMEARHRDTFHANFRLRLGRIAAETRASLHALTAPETPAHRHFSRWRGEKPPVFDDTRKILGACLLFPDPHPDRGLPDHRSAASENSPEPLDSPPSCD